MCLIMLNEGTNKEEKIKQIGGAAQRRTDSARASQAHSGYRSPHGGVDCAGRRDRRPRLEPRTKDKESSAKRTKLAQVGPEFFFVRRRCQWWQYGENGGGNIVLR